MRLVGPTPSKGMLFRSSCLSRAGALRNSSSESVPSWLVSSRSNSVRGAAAGCGGGDAALDPASSRRAATGSSSRRGGERCARIAAAGACCAGSAPAGSRSSDGGGPGGRPGLPADSSRTPAGFAPVSPGPGCPARRTPAPARGRRAEFLFGQPAVPVLVELLEGSGGIGDFIGGKDAVVIRNPALPSAGSAEDGNAGRGPAVRTGKRAAVAAGFVPAGGGSTRPRGPRQTARFSGKRKVSLGWIANRGTS